MSQRANESMNDTGQNVDAYTTKQVRTMSTREGLGEIWWGWGVVGRGRISRSASTMDDRSNGSAICCDLDYTRVYVFAANGGRFRVGGV